MVTRSAAPKKWFGKPPPFPPPVMWALAGLIENLPPLFSSVVWGLVGGNPPPSFPPGVGSGGVDSVLGSLVGVEPVVLPEWGLLVVVRLL